MIFLWEWLILKKKNKKLFTEIFLCAILCTVDLAHIQRQDTPTTS